jgi:hypothetical protein
MYFGVCISASNVSPQKNNSKSVCLLKNQVRQRDWRLCWKVWTTSKSWQQLKSWWIGYMSSNFIRSSDQISPQKLKIQISVLGEELEVQRDGKCVWKCEPVSNHNSKFCWIYTKSQFHWKLTPNSLKKNSKSVHLRKESSHTVSWKLCAQVQSHFQFWWISAIPNFMASSNQIPLFFHSILCSLQQFVNKSAGVVR